MSSAWTPFKVYSRLQNIVSDYKGQHAKLTYEIQKIQSDKRYTQAAKLDMTNEIRTRMTAERNAAEINLQQLRKDYAAELENLSPVSILGTGGLSSTSKVFLLSDAEIRTLKSLDYIQLSASDWQRLAANVDPEANPAFASAIVKKAEEQGYQFRSWYKTPEQKLAEFDRAAAGVEKLVKAYDAGSENADWIAVDVLNVIDSAVEAYDKFDNQGNLKKIEPIVLPIPQTPEEEIQMELQEQINAQKTAEADATLEERVAIAEAFGDPESAKAELMGEALSKVSQIRFERDYETTPADETAAEVTAKITEGGAVE